MYTATKENVRKSAGVSVEEMKTARAAGNGLFIGTGCPKGDWDAKLLLVADKPQLRQQVIGYKDRLGNDVYNSLFFCRMSLNNPGTKDSAKAEVTVNEALANIIEAGEFTSTFGVSSKTVDGQTYTRTEFREKPYYGENFAAVAEEVADGK